MMNSWLPGKGSNTSEVQWPDFSHIANIFLEWYKSLLLAIITVLVTAGITMVQKGMDGDTTLLEALLRTPVPSSLALEAELVQHLDCLRRQADLASTLKIQWEFVKEDESFLLAGPGEQVPLLGTRYLLTDALYDRMVQAGQISRFEHREWLEKQRGLDGRQFPLLVLIGEKTMMLDAIIKQMEEHLQKQETALKEEASLTPSAVSLIVRREIVSLQESIIKSTTSQVEDCRKKMDVQEAEMDRLKKAVHVMDKSSNASEEDPLAVHLNANERRHLDGNKVRVMVNDENIADDEYWSRMVNEVSDNGESEAKGGAKNDERAVKVRKVEPPRDRGKQNRVPSGAKVEAVAPPIVFGESQRARELEREIAKMEKDLASFPYRHREDDCKGISLTMKCAFCRAEGEHFSDACTLWRSGDARRNIVRSMGCYNSA
ncbi:unnamed protein product [Heligmosomoides polygyrus]|uniref:PHM7_cyt domain-containing protein n=1 Tax=Heligmosomoides polygyrus TaxID=6339 RepID=A0A183F5Z2_HELPZ|nr:unnamed protein product [Heligmosomoides polygyrus]